MYLYTSSPLSLRFFSASIVARLSQFMPWFFSLCSPFFAGRFISFFIPTAHDKRHTLPPCASAHRLHCRTIYQFQCLPDDLSVLYFCSDYVCPPCPKKAAEKLPLVLEERNDLFPSEPAKILSVCLPCLVLFIPLGGLQNLFPPLSCFPCGCPFSHFSHATQSPAGRLASSLFSLLGFTSGRVSIGLHSFLMLHRWAMAVFLCFCGIFYFGSGLLYFSVVCCFCRLNSSLSGSCLKPDHEVKGR